MKNILLRLLLFVISFTAINATLAAAQSYLYRVTLVQAAPGKFNELVAAYKYSATFLPKEDEQPLWMRHSQGDHWDLLILWPMDSYAEYHMQERERARHPVMGTSSPPVIPWDDLIATQEDVYVYGPPVGALRTAFAQSKFYHVEMFQALPGKHVELHKEREMENQYQRVLKRPENFIFTRESGAAWDLFTIGCYRDLKHYAESADILEKDQNDAAVAAGFESASQIGPYLRKFISSHHDTLAVAVK